MSRFVCKWRVQVDDRPPSRETVTLLLAERIGSAWHGFNSLPGAADAWAAEFEVEAHDLAAAREAAEQYGPTIRVALARYDGAGLRVGELEEVRPAATADW